MTENEKPRAEVYCAVMLERDEDGCNHIVVVAGWVCMSRRRAFGRSLWDAADETARIASRKSSARTRARGRPTSFA